LKKNSTLVNEDVIGHVKDIVACLTTCQSKNTFLKNIHSILKTITHADNFYVVLQDENRDISFPYFVDTKDSFTEEELNQVKIDDLNATLTYLALESNVPCDFSSNDIIELQKNNKIKTLGTIPKQWLCYPLVNKGHSLGAFVIQSYRTSSEYCSYVLEVLLAISHVIASALDAFNNNEKLKLANEELTSHRDNLGCLVLERTQELKLKTQKLESEIKLKNKIRVDLESGLKVLESEIVEREQLQNKLEFEVTHDSLTGLANRKALYNAKNRITEKIKRNKKKLFILYLDVDGFKAVNDTLGHQIGDNVLIEISQKILARVREYDLVARVGGDEFVVLMEDVENKNDIQVIAKRIIDDIEASMIIGQSGVELSISIGIAYSSEPEHIEFELLRCADNAMYQAKKKGSGNVVWFKE